jgi:predicted ATP-grasp superfamily ATP-dependent carboligase
MAAEALALVIGDIDLVRALGLAGIASAFSGDSDAPARFSRHVQAQLPWTDDQEKIVAALLRFADEQPEPPVLYPQTDAALLMAAHHRERLGTAFRFALADTALIDELVDKDRFQALAERHSLPVPFAYRLAIGGGHAHPPALDVAFPLIVKPLIRTREWKAVAAGGKAMHVRGPDDWAALWPRLATWRSDVVVQQLVPGPVTALESYHAYVDERGAIAGEFTGRKIRTYPALHGYSTAVEVVDLPDVAALGRDVLARLGLRGVAKADFKRDEHGRLHLLEVNPRFNLWHHPAAVAGVNLPALVHADLTGATRPPGCRATRRVTWCTPLTDLRAAHAAGMSPVRWLRWARTCDVMSSVARDDPLPFVRGTLWSAVRRRTPLRRRAA